MWLAYSGDSSPPEPPLTTPYPPETSWGPQPLGVKGSSFTAGVALFAGPRLPLSQPNPLSVVDTREGVDLAADAGTGVEVPVVAALAPALARERERFLDFEVFVDDVDAAALLDTLGAHLSVALPPMLQISPQPPLLLPANGFLEAFDEDIEPASTSQQAGTQQHRKMFLHQRAKKTQ